MAHKRSEAKIKDLIAGTTLVTSFLSGIERAAQQNGASELDVYKLMNGSGHLNFDQMVQFSMQPHRVAPLLEIEAPPGGRIEQVSVVVDYKRSWKKLLSAAAPETRCGPLGGWGGVWSEMPPTLTLGQFHKERILLVNFGEMEKSKMHPSDAREWGARHGLMPARQRECLAVGEHEPFLHRDLNPGKSITLLCVEEYIVENDRRSLGFVCRDESRRAFHYKLGFHGFLKEDEWVAFVRAPKKQD